MPSSLQETGFARPYTELNAPYTFLHRHFTSSPLFRGFGPGPDVCPDRLELCGLPPWRALLYHIGYTRESSRTFPKIKVYIYVKG